MWGCEGRNTLAVHMEEFNDIGPIESKGNV
jgi:hypothetical protein